MVTVGLAMVIAKPLATAALGEKPLTIFLLRILKNMQASSQSSAQKNTLRVRFPTR